MTIITVLAEPPRPGLVLSELMEMSPLSEAEAADLYAAMPKDVCIAVGRSSNNLPVNYRAEDELPDELTGDHSSEVEIRSVVADAPGGTNSVRFEPQVGLMFSARAGNTISYLLNEEGEVHSVAVVRPIAPLLDRTRLDSAAMKLRNMSVALGPSTEGRVYFLGFLDPVDFTGAYAEPEVETLARRANDVGRSLDYVPMLPVLETGVGLATVVPMPRSRVESERLVSEHTTTFVFKEGLRVESTDGVLELVHD